MISPSASYAEQLVSQGHGLPLWRPESAQEGPTEVGDVGVFNDGEFVRLFNVLASPKGSENNDKVPGGFIPLNVDVPQPQILPACSISTSSVKLRRDDKFPKSTGEHTSYDFTWVGKRGALVVLIDPGEQLSIEDEPVQEYMLMHHKSWCDYAKSKNFDQDLVLVSGWTRTSRWALATFSRETPTAEPITISFTPELSAGEKFVFRNPSGAINVDQRWGPGERAVEGLPGPEAATCESPKNQTVFLQYYKIKQRESTDDADSHDARCLASGALGKHIPLPRRRATVEQGPYEAHKDPLDEVLNYMLKQSNTAIANFGYLYDMCPPSRWPEDLKTYFKSRKATSEKNDLAEATGILQHVALERTAVQAGEAPTDANEVASEPSNRRQTDDTLVNEALVVKSSRHGRYTPLVSRGGIVDGPKSATGLKLEDTLEFSSQVFTGRPVVFTPVGEKMPPLEGSGLNFSERTGANLSSMPPPRQGTDGTFSALNSEKNPHAPAQDDETTSACCVIA